VNRIWETEISLLGSRQQVRAWRMPLFRSPTMVRPHRLSCRKPLRCGGGVLALGGTSCALNVEPEYDRVGVVMAEDFNNSNVVMVATIIGGVVFLLALWGLFSKFL